MFRKYGSFLSLFQVFCRKAICYEQCSEVLVEERREAISGGNRACAAGGAIGEGMDGGGRFTAAPGPAAGGGGIAGTGIELVGSSRNQHPSSVGRSGNGRHSTRPVSEAAW